MPDGNSQRAAKLALLAADLTRAEEQSDEARRQLRHHLEELERLASVREELEKRIQALLSEGGDDDP